MLKRILEDLRSARVSHPFLVAFALPLSDWGVLVVHLAHLKAFDLHSKRCAFDHLSKLILSPENCVLNEPACPRHPELQDEGLAFVCSVD